MNDRQRTEAVFFPLWMMNVMHTGAANREEEDFKVVWGYLNNAVAEVLRGCDAKKTAYIIRRATRLHDRVMADFIKGSTRSDKVGLIMAYVLQAALECDYLVLDEGSELAEAANAILFGLREAKAKQKVDASARKQAARTLQALKDEGYFLGVDMPVDAG